MWKSLGDNTVMITVFWHVKAEVRRQIVVCAQVDSSSSDVSASDGKDEILEVDCRECKDWC